jgi:AcrR family transcriptional regulator
MMAAPIRTERGKWIQQGLRALAAGGPDAVRIEPLAQALGVTRGGFYWHFRDRRALLDEMLDTWEQVTTQDLRERLDREGGDAAAKLRRLLALTSPRVVRLDLAVRDWARRDQAVAQRLKRVDNQRMDILRSLFGARRADPGDIEARCLLAFSLLIGNYFITAGHPGRSREDVLELALTQLGPGSAVTGARPTSNSPA